MKNSFPYLALTIGLICSLVIFKGSQLNQDGNTLLPLLTLLIICEISFIITAIGGYMSARQIISTQFSYAVLFICVACVLLALQFMISGLRLWPD